MKCFNHQNIDAVGQCKHCYKGLCIECATDMGHGIACKNKHENEVVFLNELIENNKKTYSSSPKTAALSNMIYLLMGIPFIYWGWSKPNYTLMGLGIIFVVYWAAISIYNSKIFKTIKTNYET